MHHSECPSSELGLPQTLYRKRVCPPPRTKGWGAHSPAAKGVGESQFRRLEKKLSTLPALWTRVCTSSTDQQIHSPLQRRHGSILEYQAMSSFRDVAHDGWLWTFIMQQQLEIPSDSSWAAPVRATGTVRKRRALRPVHHVQNHTCAGSLSSIYHLARRPALLGRPSSLRPHWSPPHFPLILKSQF